MNIILEKIKKLLRMKRGGTPAEVETALAMARELARKHNIDIATVNPDEQSEERLISHDDAARSGRIQWEQKYAMLVCQEFFNVSAVLRRVGYRQMRVTFIGTRSDLAIAFYIFRFLTSHFRRAWNGSKGLRNRQAFLYGMYIGLSSKLDQERKAASPLSESALVIVKSALARREKYIAASLGELEDQDCRPDGDAKRAQWAGFIEGKKTEIRKGVKSAASQSNLLT